VSERQEYGGVLLPLKTTREKERMPLIGILYMQTGHYTKRSIKEKSSRAAKLDTIQRIYKVLPAQNLRL
jgi:hypothetical protein